MKIESVSSQVSVSDQLSVDDLQELANAGVQVIVCNRPDKEDNNQTPFYLIAEKAESLGMETHHIPFASRHVSLLDRDRFAKCLQSGKRLHAYCRTGNRSKTIWLAATDVNNTAKTTHCNKHVDNGSTFDVVIVGAGSAGIATASSLHKRNSALRIVLIDPSSVHYYQPGWTLVGGGVFKAEETCRKMTDVIPNYCEWIQQSVKHIHGSQNKVVLENNTSVYYEHLVVCPGLILNWSAIEGLEESLGKNGVTSNYRYDLAPYTWELISHLEKGKAIFTQPPMPIKCAGAPQKAMYLAASEWFRKGKLKDMSVQFYNAGGVLFGVEAYVPALMTYVKKYNAELCFKQALIKIDGPNQKAWFKNSEGEVTESSFDMIHVCPPQIAPTFIHDSGLADSAGWMDVDSNTLQSKQHANIWGVGDVLNTTNAKTMAAARKQAPVVAHNIVSSITNKTNHVHYDGYGSCPLMVEHGKVVLAEFTYGGKLSPSFPTWLNNGTQATSFGWFLKERLLPFVYWHGMLKGREWLAKPHDIKIRD